MTKTGGESLLLDTHIWFWYAMDDDSHTTPSAWSNVTEAAARQAAGVSEITFWELALKSGKGRLELNPDPRTWLRAARERAGVGVIDVDRDVLIDSALLKMGNRDPADRIIVTTALHYAMRLATADEDLLRYAETNRRFQVLDMRA